jgi:hypothetical protein
MKTSVIVLVLGLSAAAQLADPLARFSYSADLARRMNAVDATQPNTGAPRFVVDDARGRELAGAQLLGAIQSLIRAFPGCGNRELQFTYAYGEAPKTYVIAFSQTTKRAPECPATVTVTVSTSGAVTVRSSPQA